MWFFFCAYNEPNTDFHNHADLCLHKDLHGCENLYLANVHHRAAKRDGVRSPGVRVHTKPWLITNVKKTGIEPVFHHNYSFLFQEEPVSCKCSNCDDQEDKDYNKRNRKMSLIIVIFFV